MSDETSLPQVFAACKRGGDIATKGQVCKSRSAYKLSGTSRNVAFRCVSCGHEWSVDQGGPIEY